MKAIATHENWSSRFTFLMAAIGSAVGLGNIWKFPYIAGVSGGGAFVLIYLGAVVLVAMPILMGELMIGRRGKMSPPNAMRAVARETRAGFGRRWGLVGWLGVAAAFLILTFYSVIAGWALAFLPKIASGVFSGVDGAGVDAEFSRLLADPVELMVWHSLFIGITAFVVARGIHGGIEKAVNFMMPALFVMLLVMVGYAAVEGDFAAGLHFMFAPDFSKITANVVLMAVGQAFFSIGVALGAMMTYGAYLPRNVSIPKAAAIIAFADTAVALLAGLAIFPIVFANGLDPAEGTGLIFVTLPLAFGAMPAGAFFGTVFFVLLLFAAVTSSISILEPAVSWAEEHKGMSRERSALIAGLLAWVVGLGSVYSLNVWSDFYPLGFLERFATMTIFDLLDYITANIMLPLGGLFIALFAGWWMAKKTTREELGFKSEWSYLAWRFLVRFIAPLALVAIFAFNLIG